MHTQNVVLAKWNFVKTNINSPVQPLSELAVHTLFLTCAKRNKWDASNSTSLLSVWVWASSCFQFTSCFIMKVRSSWFSVLLLPSFVLFPTLVSVWLRSPVPFYPLVCIWSMSVSSVFARSLSSTCFHLLLVSVFAFEMPFPPSLCNTLYTFSLH